jgi:hypothetical protein
MSPGLLNLTEADESGFNPLPPGQYLCEIFSAEMAATKGREGSALPKGTPMLRIQYKVLSTADGDPEVWDDAEEENIKLEGKNRRLFDNLVAPPKEIDGEPYEYYEMMNGQIVRRFMAFGFEKDEIKNPKGFNPDLEALEGTQVVVTVGRDAQGNPVKGVKAAGDREAAGLL